eukprot:5607517-Alexandrium_andersonii.AAC.1
MGRQQPVEGHTGGSPTTTPTLLTCEGPPEVRAEAGGLPLTRGARCCASSGRALRHILQGELNALQALLA